MVKSISVDFLILLLAFYLLVAKPLFKLGDVRMIVSTPINQSYELVTGLFIDGLNKITIWK